MNNLEILNLINTPIFKSLQNNKYYIRIPFVQYNSENTYIENYNNSLYVLLNDNLLNNDDLEDFIKLPDNRYEYNTKDEIGSLIIIYSHDYNYFVNLNNIEIEDEDIKNLNQTFMNIIKETYRYNNSEVTDYTYKSVIDYYANGQYDDAIILMNSIFNTSINTSISNCGCNTQSNCQASSNSTNVINTGTELVNYDKASCIDKYRAAMYQLLINMLSDVNFYCDWLFIKTDDDIYIPNENLLNKLIELLQFVLNNFDLSSLNSNSLKCSNHGSSNKCDSYYDSDIDKSICSNYKIIEDYIKLLNYIKDNQLEENQNKIYIYGKKFAEIFPLLSF